MNNKQSLYTKYRPQTFDQVVGQSVVKEILINSIAKNKINHAYLFFGIRGTGKTTLARIFAKAINCKNRDEYNNPCNECDSCLTITNGSALDVIEIDAASNNGVDEIRQIKENTSYLTSSADYKVYIIDEVHMLTKAAFNALLKTLEEPPRNTIFMLATTELQKIPQTVLSRTIILNLEVMSDEDIKRGLKIVLNGEKTSFDEEALDYIVMTASGSLRDGISALETTLLYNNELSIDNVLSALGLIKKEQISNLLNNDSSKLVDIIENTDRDASKIAILIMEVVMEQLKNRVYGNAELLNKIVKITNTISDPLLLKIALKSAILTNDVSRVTSKVNNDVESVENHLINEVDNKESGKPLPYDENHFSNRNEVEINNAPPLNNEVFHKESEKENIVENVENFEREINSEPIIKAAIVPDIKDISEEKNNFINNSNDESIYEIITDYVDVNNYLFIIKNNNQEELDKISTRWKNINNYVSSMDYKEILPTISNTTPLAATDKTIIVGFHSENQLSEFKKQSLTPLLFEFVKNVLNEYRFILPINEETWEKLLIAKDAYKPNDKYQDVPLEMEKLLNKTIENKRTKLDDLFGKENVKHE